MSLALAAASRTPTVPYRTSVNCFNPISRQRLLRRSSEKVYFRIHTNPYIQGNYSRHRSWRSWYAAFQINLPSESTDPEFNLCERFGVLRSWSRNVKRTGIVAGTFENRKPEVIQSTYQGKLGDSVDGAGGNEYQLIRTVAGREVVVRTVT
jgi:hypothetical protein